MKTIIKEIIEVIEKDNIKVLYDAMAPFFYKAAGMYGDGEIILTPVSDLRVLLHELGHAIEDKLGVLDKNKKRTGEFTAHLFSFMMLFNEEDPSEIFTEALDKYLSGSADLVWEGVDSPLDHLEAARRAVSAFEHPLAGKVRKTINDLIGE